MYLKSLTLKGFKSFASATTLNFEPGITAVVGPNGSGKSNVVDAIAWVLGEQGAKALRGGKMEDVIFAGTADRPPLGRAEVTLTINNADGALPIDYAEVAITRRMFRDGASEYEINGSSCRLLDIQDLLSDSGIGREMHVIVGQGQLDAVLSARPEDRRAFIEEAAGVLKHRKRKEKALRKLDSMQANLTRLGDLTGELRRQLKPLGRQAEVARRAVTVQSELRDAKLRLLADDYVSLSDLLAKEAADEEAARSYREQVRTDLAAATAELERAQAQLVAATPALQAAQDTWFTLSALAERLRGTVSLAQERGRHLAAPLETSRPGRDPEELEAAAEAAEEAQAEKEESVDQARETLAEVVASRSELEARLRATEAELVAATAAIADRREGLAKISGQVAAASSRLIAIDDEIARLSEALADSQERAALAQQEFETLRESVGELDESEVGLDEAHEQAEAAAEGAQERVHQLTELVRELRGEQGSLRARVEALAMGLDRRDGVGSLLAGADELAGFIGSVATVVTVQPGAEVAIAAALGVTADAVAVAGMAAAVDAITYLRATDGGRAGMVIGGAPANLDRSGWPQLPAGLQWAVDAVQGPAAVLPALQRTLDRVVLVENLSQARDLIEHWPQLRAVTQEGDLLGADWAVGGSVGKQSVIEIQAAVDGAETALAQVTTRLAESEAALAGAKAEAQLRLRDAEASLAALNHSDAQLSAVAEQLGRIGEVARSAAAEADRLAKQRDAATQSREQHQHSLTELENRLHAAQSEEAPTAIDGTERDLVAEEVAVARQLEMESRLVLRSAEERARASAGAAESLRRTARAEREARARVEASRQRRVIAAAIADQVARWGSRAAAILDESLAEAAAERDTAQEFRAAAEQTAVQVRQRQAALSADWEKLNNAAHRDELQRTQQLMKIDQFVTRMADEFAITAEELVAEFGPDIAMPPTHAEIAEYETAKERGDTVSAPMATPFDRAEIERRVKRGERDLSLLGKVNPLALEEFAALEERHAFLSTQLQDLKDTRKDLLTVVAEVDDKILEVFTSAYHDVAREFVTVFSTLFPGGEGELVLTDPSNMLTTGIEVHARPPGKKVKRLSLLSGGERSLTAVAMLVAIFRARPSPFYIMDEVEAALDETNLNRLVGLLTELRDSSQLIIITHQKFTMEAADALYGVSMRGDGITQVISQRIRGVVSATKVGPVTS